MMLIAMQVALGFALAAGSNGSEAPRRCGDPDRVRSVAQEDRFRADEDEDEDPGAPEAGATQDVTCGEEGIVTFAVTHKKFKVEVKIGFTDACPGGTSLAWVSDKGSKTKRQVCKVGDQTSTDCKFILDDMQFVHFECGSDQSSEGTNCTAKLYSRKMIK
jgi:hypothetical protein